MQATHPDHLRQLVDEHRRARQQEASGNRLIRHRRTGRVAFVPSRVSPSMTSRVIVMARRLRQPPWRTNPAARAGTP